MNLAQFYLALQCASCVLNLSLSRPISSNDRRRVMERLQGLISHRCNGHIQTDSSHTLIFRRDTERHPAYWLSRKISVNSSLEAIALTYKAGFLHPLTSRGGAQTALSTAASTSCKNINKLTNRYHRSQYQATP